MNTKLKVGDSFEVVQPLTNSCYDDAFKTTRSTIINPETGNVICNSDFYRRTYHLNEGGMYDSINSLHLADSDLRRIGKLTITKLK